MEKVWYQFLHGSIILNSDSLKLRCCPKLSKNTPCWLASRGLKSGGEAAQTHPCLCSSNLPVLGYDSNLAMRLCNSEISAVIVSQAVRASSKAELTLWLVRLPPRLCFSYSHCYYKGVNTFVAPSAVLSTI